MKTYDYAFRFAKDGDGWVITCRDLPEAISQAEAKEDRVEVAEGCLQAALESRIRDSEPLSSVLWPPWSDGRNLAVRRFQEIAAC